MTIRDIIDWRVPAKHAWQLSEARLQTTLVSMALVTYASTHREILLLHAIPNGDWRGFATGVKLRGAGVIPGIPDLCLPVPRGGYHGLYLELKKAGGAVKLAQWEIMEDLHRQGYYVRVTNQLDTAMKLLGNYLFLTETKQIHNMEPKTAISETKQFRKDLDAVLQDLKLSSITTGPTPCRASRERSIAVTKLQEAIMWLGMDLKAINEESPSEETANPYPQSYNPESPVIEPTADGLKL